MNEKAGREASGSRGQVGKPRAPCEGRRPGKMAPVELGLGASSYGRQFISWITLCDLLGSAEYCLREEVFAAENAVGPEPSSTRVRQDPRRVHADPPSSRCPFPRPTRMGEMRRPSSCASPRSFRQAPPVGLRSPIRAWKWPSATNSAKGNLPGSATIRRRLPASLFALSRAPSHSPDSHYPCP